MNSGPLRSEYQESIPQADLYGSICWGWGTGGDARGASDSEAAPASVRGKEGEKWWKRFRHSTAKERA